MSLENITWLEICEEIQKHFPSQPRTGIIWVYATSPACSRIRGRRKRVVAHFKRIFGISFAEANRITARFQ